MFKLFLPLFLILSLSSCYTAELTQLDTAHRVNPITIKRVSEISRNELWDRAIRLFADHNLPIKIIDKNSGFIESDLLSFVASYQIDSTGIPSDSMYVVTQRENAGNMIIEPSYITGYLKIFILDDSLQTEIRVSIESLKSYHIQDIHHSHSSIITHKEMSREVGSTGNLESQVINYIGNSTDSISNLFIINGTVLNPKENYSRYLKKKQNIAIGSLIGAELGGCGLLATIMILALKR